MNGVHFCLCRAGPGPGSWLGWDAREGSQTSRPRKVTGEFLAWLYEAITMGNPQQYQLPFFLWTLKLVRQVLKRHHGIVLSKSSTSRLLQQLGLSPQKPVSRSYKQRSEELQAYWEETFPKLQRNAKRQGAAILHVVKRLFPQTEPVLTTHRTQQAEWLQLSQDLIRIRRRAGRTLLQKTRSALTGSDLKIVERVAFGNEAQEILKAAKQARTDLIVMGLRGLTGFRRLFPGSVSDHIVHNAGCSVAVIRNKNQK